jgi:hypothetical protein
MTYLLSKSIPNDPNREIDFLLVQCSTYNTTNRARIAAKAMFDLHRFDVPIAVGLYTGEDNMPQLPAAAGFELSDFIAAGGTVYYGEAYLAGLMAAATPTDPLFVVEIAPATSLGGVVAQAPTLAANVITTAMSGSVYHGYGNSSGPGREYNVVQNISASQAMYASSWLSPLMQVGGISESVLGVRSSLFQVVRSGTSYDLATSWSVDDGVRRGASAEHEKSNVTSAARPLCGHPAAPRAQAEPTCPFTHPACAGAP